MRWSAAAIGHSQGGKGALVAGGDPRVDTTIPFQPGPNGDNAVPKLHGPMLALAGSRDIICPPRSVHTYFDAADHIVAAYGELAGEGHFSPLGDGGGYRGPITAWFRFHLMGDEQAHGMFFGSGCTLCTSTKWKYERNAKANAIAGP